MQPFPFLTTWDRNGLADIGFTGFVTFADIRTPRVLRLPVERGIYVVLRLSDAEPAFRFDSPAKGSLYELAELQRRWVPDSPILYFGKADGTRGLHHRLKQFARRGNSHTGGRAIWQLTDADDLIVAWAPTPGEFGRDVEKRFIARFVEQFGKRPFANVDD